MIEPIKVLTDFSALEKRVAETMQVWTGNTFIDLHILTAARLFGVPYSNVTTTQRRAGKERNFGNMYSEVRDVDLLIPGAEEMARLFSPDELAEHCKSSGVSTVEQLVLHLRGVYTPKKESTVTHRVVKHDPQPWKLP